jgi:hypothetical protein
MTWQRKPGNIVAADWSSRTEHRIECAAVWCDSHYVISAPDAVGDPGTFLKRVESRRPNEDGVLIGFDFPIGLPIAYADQAGIESFYIGLELFGSRGKWKNFYQVSNAPSLYQPFYPLPPVQRGQVSRKVLETALKIEWDNLLRECERATNDRRAACPLFWTLGGNQVGRAAVHGWENVLVPGIFRIKLWPFDGTLRELISAGHTVVAEIYPAEACAQMGIRFGQGQNLRKTRRADRQSTVGRIENWIRKKKLPVLLDPPAREAFLAGFKSDDHYDAFVGLLSMIEVVFRESTNYEPYDDHARQVEGWILGQESCDSG